MRKIDTKDFKEIVYDFNSDQKSYKNNKPLIIDFYADWCVPCKNLSPILEELEKENDFNVYKVDSEEEYELSEHFNIKSVPTLLFVPVNSEPVSITGSFPKSILMKYINQYFKK